VVIDVREEIRVPEIRFEGFKEPWKLFKLRNIGEFKSNGVNKKISHDEEPVYLLNYMDVYNRIELNSQNYQKLMKVTAKPTQLINNNILCGDVLITPSSETADDIGRVMAIEEDIPNTVYSYHLVRYRPKQGVFYNVYPNYGFSSKSVRKQLVLSAQGVQRFVIGKSAFEELGIYLPVFKEQQKIGNFFKNIDSLITNSQKKYKKLQNIKKALLEKMFPKDGECVPEIRFKGFKDDWVKREIREISSSFSGGTPNVSVSENYGGSIPFIRSGEINSESTKLFITDKGIDNSSAKIVNSGDILYAMYGATSGEVAVSKISGAINQAILAIQVKEEIDAYALVQLLKREKGNIISTYLQGGQGNLSGDIIKKIKVVLSVYENEQKKIGQFFQNIDNIITFHKKKCDSLINLKKALLEKMFV
jgi:type I restriction enzyme S subunit